MNVEILTSRSCMIEALTKSMFDDIEMNLEKLEDLIYQGFKGYNNFTNEELIAEYKEYISEEDPDSIIIELIGEQHAM